MSEATLWVARIVLALAAVNLVFLLTEVALNVVGLAL
jgi:hypothetical protein